MTTTSTIDSMTQATAKQISEGAMKALEEFAAGLGIEVTRGRSGTYDPTAGTLGFKIEFQITANKADGFNRDRDHYCLTDDNSDLHYGAQFTVGGKTYTVDGFNLRAAKRPVVTQCSDGKTYTWPLQSVRTHLGLGTPAHRSFS